VTRLVLIAARRSFDRIAARAMLRERLPQINVRECATAQELADEIARFRRAIVIVERALLQPELEAALASFGARAIRIGDHATIDLGRLANDLPLQLEQALAVIAVPDRPSLRTQKADARIAAPNLFPPSLEPQCVLVASSTGGPTALATLLSALPASSAPWIVAQHMPGHGSGSLAEHLAAVSGLPVRVCGGGPVAPGINLLEGGRDFVLNRDGDGALRLKVAVNGASPFHPNADRLFLSAADLALPCVVVVLSGMGQDGAEGAARLGAQGAAICVQKPDTCVVAGMPRAALELCRTARMFDPKAPPEALRRLGGQTH
jgi:two-component system chemotaxis response regulator CheB